MKKWNLIISSGFLSKMNDNDAEAFKDLASNGFEIIIISHDAGLLNYLFKNRKEAEFNYKLKLRGSGEGSIRDFLKDDETASTSIIIGVVEEDLFLAANRKIILLNPNWIETDKKIKKYGVCIPNLTKLLEILQVLHNQGSWYYKLDLSTKTTLLCLTKANTMNYDVSASEKEMVEHFRSVLKNNASFYEDVLLFHFLSGVTQYNEFRNVDFWGAMPSSSGQPSAVLQEFKERCRYLTNRRSTQDILIRKVPTTKSHETTYQTRMRDGASKHVNSMIINPYYLDKLKGKEVCLIDDYVTYGATMEAARALLEKAGVKRLLLVGLGRYMKNSGIYIKENLSITGDLYSVNHRVKKIAEDSNWGQRAVIDNHARDDLRRMYEILKV